MDRNRLESTFDRSAPTYDQQWAKLAPFRDGIHLLLGALFTKLAPDSRMLCIGAGTGAEIQYLAGRFPGWTFTAVEPSRGMADACRRRAEEHGFAERCTVHDGYLEALAETGAFDCATSLLVSQFILDRDERSSFFRGIADRLRPGGILASSDLATDLALPSAQGLLEVWLRTMAAADVPPEGIQRMREAYARDVSILPLRTIEALIEAAGFEPPTPFFQAGLIRAWYTRRTP